MKKTVCLTLAFVFSLALAVSLTGCAVTDTTTRRTRVTPRVTDYNYDTRFGDVKPDRGVTLRPSTRRATDNAGMYNDTTGHAVTPARVTPSAPIQASPIPSRVIPGRVPMQNTTPVRPNTTPNVAS